MELSNYKQARLIKPTKIEFLFPNDMSIYI